MSSASSVNKGHPSMVLVSSNHGYDAKSEFYGFFVELNFSNKGKPQIN